MFIVLDMGHQQPYGPFSTETEAQTFANNRNNKLPIQSEKWEHVILPLKSPAAYGVYDNGKPASREGFPVLKGSGWETHRFQTVVEAQHYASQWLGQFDVGTLMPGTPVDYSGCGDIIEIREMQ